MTRPEKWKQYPF